MIRVNMIYETYLLIILICIRILTPSEYYPGVSVKMYEITNSETLEKKK